jgi:molybdopterin/thiamine biosynthesis adenylyltransferase
VILGGLDNREARVAINLAAARAGKGWIDGAIERLEGVARVFDLATGQCYECIIGENDWKMLEARRSCALLSRDELELGKVPTTPTTASIIAGIQVQEAIWKHAAEDTSVEICGVLVGSWHRDLAGPFDALAGPRSSSRKAVRARLFVALVARPS